MRDEGDNLEESVEKHLLSSEEILDIAYRAEGWHYAGNHVWSEKPVYRGSFDVLNVETTYHGWGFLGLLFGGYELRVLNDEDITITYLGTQVGNYNREIRKEIKALYHDARRQSLEKIKSDNKSEKKRKKEQKKAQEKIRKERVKSEKIRKEEERRGEIKKRIIENNEEVRKARDILIYHKLNGK